MLVILRPPIPVAEGVAAYGKAADIAPEGPKCIRGSENLLSVRPGNAEKDRSN